MFLSDSLERRIKIKSYQPFWCWNFLITHEFGQIFSSVALKLCCSLKSSGYQTEKNHLYGINIQGLAFLRQKPKLKQYWTLKSKSWKIFSADCWMFSQYFQASWSWYSTDCWVHYSAVIFLMVLLHKSGTSGQHTFVNLAQITAK